MGNPVVHFEIVGKEGGALQDFYRRAFGWKVDADNPMGYGMVDTGGDLAGGISGADGEHNWVTVYIEVADPAATLKRLEELGARTLMGETAVPGGPTMAQFEDPAGNMVGLVKAD